MGERRSPRIHAGSRMKEMMAAYYLEAKNAADNNQKVAWITSGGLVELLIAMDVIPVYPENHGAMCGVTRMGVDLCEVAEQMGYSRDLCSYARTDIGSAVTGKSPIMGLPKPDFLLCCNNICGTVTKWYEVLARFFDVPLVYIDAPFIHDQLTESSVEYVKRQIKRAIKQMEGILGRKFDMDRFTDVVVRSGDASRLWGETLSMCKNIPSPMSAFDGFILMAPIVTLRGKQEVIDFYEMLKQELEGRVTNGVAATPGETYRLLWDNLPIWFKMRDLSERFIDLKACIVASTYLNAWALYELDATDPVDGIARAYASAFVNESIQHRANLMRDIVEQYSVDGIIFHSNRSCRPYSLGQYDIKEMLTESTGVPGILIEADMNDERAYAEGPVFTRIEAFIETLKPRREATV
ncbi:MAG: 2-hydroxyacyl-CoA dehydratase [Candidatus Abyssobacteria bacterium SURF_17]|uniref:2-hydroxyacyl-CoA dehydratase n=1 Tax=Candidatus Abyssobacteria bacterium SURF_17 TaxID=2093361 RepID=A0A419ERA5_9BACT|nr:MAG: 2-hydroxyacyl-CoA dehydratase [Candidatus Abyssubacteria bacterium SURF_17]